MSTVYADDTAAPPAPAAAAPRSLLERLAASPLSFANISLVYVWAAVFVLFALWVPDKFLTATTWQSMAGEQAVTVILALAVVVALAAGVFDLSVGAVMGATAILVAKLMAGMGMSPVPAALATLVAGALAGCVTATMVVVFRVHSFIATLGIGSVLTAFVSAVSNNQLIIGLPTSFQQWATFEVLGIQGAFWIALVLAATIWFVLEHRPVGRFMYATGSNAEAARLAGVRTDRVTFGTIVCTALIATVAGIVVTSRIATGSPTIGPPYLLPAFAAAFLGSTQIRQGRFNVLGTLIAVYALATGVKGLQLAGAPFWLPDLFNGVALLVAVALSVRRRQLTSRPAKDTATVRVRPPLTLREAARPHLEELRDSLDESVWLTEPAADGGTAKVVEAAESRRTLRIVHRPGDPRQADDPDATALRRTTAGALAVEDEQVITVAAPVLTEDGRAVAAVSVCAPRARVDEGFARRMNNAVAETARRIAAQLNEPRTS
ncbi:IclR family transcriptional regulator C-terminal domain-containing protein [Streptomyces mirabilis]|uniref:ABC transporter permease subunit n=1 Tax=Streptomyces mirabilis TaxID=68239 RepID=UPI00368D7719